MKILSKIKAVSGKGLLLGALAATIITVGVVAAGQSNAEGVNCDSNAVVYCGAGSVGSLVNKYDSGDHLNSATSIHHIYSWFGISSGDIHNMNQTAKLGSVTKSGDVIVGGQVVATNALTAGRSFIGGSNRVTNAGTTFYVRPPSVSFQENSLSAFVVMQNGQFQFAVLRSCGNPVKATPKQPQQKPNYNIVKEVREKGDNNWHKQISVKAGTHVEYRVTVKSTGNTAVKNVNVVDNLPNQDQYVSGSLTRDGQAIGAKDFFGNGYNINSLASGNSTVFKFEAVIAPNDNANKCQKDTFINRSRINAPSLPAENDTATVIKVCAPPPPPTPEEACTNLDANAVDRNTFKFVAHATASHGAKIQSYNFKFGDGKSVVSQDNTATHSYAQPGTYNSSVTVKVKLPNGNIKEVDGNACKATVKVKPPTAPKPAAKCTGLKADVNGLDVTATATDATRGGAKFVSASFDWGDSTSPTVVNALTSSHTYAQAGKYLIVATLSFSSPSGQINSTCKVPVKLTVPPTPQPVFTCDKFNVTTSDHTVTASNFSVTASGGATFTSADIDWGDGSDVVTTPNVIGQQHTYSDDGPFDIVVVAHFSVDGQDVTASGPNCTQQVSFTTPVCTGNNQPPECTPPCTGNNQPPECTPPCTGNNQPPECTPVCSGSNQPSECTPVCTGTNMPAECTPQASSTTTSLVNTGPGQVAGIFAGVSAAGTLGYRYFLRRRLSRQ